MTTENTRVLYLDLPETVKGYTVRMFDGYFLIVLNSKLNHEQNRKTYNHEVDHILHEDFDSMLTADQIEQMRR